MDVYDQAPFACRFQWGAEGARRAARAGHIVIVVDVLVFSTSTITAIAQGAAVRPAGSIEEAREAAPRWNAVELFGRARPTAEGWSHSPPSLTGVPAGTRLIYYSANGSRCCSAAAEGSEAVLVGALVNAAAVAEAAARLHEQTGRPITVVACGERWEDDSLRPSLEDELGAGAIIAGLRLSKSAEADAAAALFEARRDQLEAAVWDCASGRELRHRQYEGDVTFAAELDRFQVVPIRDRDGWLTAM